MAAEHTRQANRAQIWSLSFSAGKAAEPAALSAAIGCSICGSLLTGGGAGAATTGCGSGALSRRVPVPATQAITTATTIPMSHATLRRAALSTSSSHILRHFGSRHEPIIYSLSCIQPFGGAVAAARAVGAHTAGLRIADCTQCEFSACGAPRDAAAVFQSRHARGLPPRVARWSHARSMAPRPRRARPGRRSGAASRVIAAPTGFGQDTRRIPRGDR